MKVVKAKCQKTGKGIIMQVSDDGKQVLGYYRTDTASYEAMQSEVRLNNATYGVPCATCRSNKVGGCDHKYTAARCSSGSLMDKGCITCKYLVPDYGRAKRTGVVQIHAGECAALELNKLRIGVGWDSHVDIDSSVVECGNGCMELVYFGDLNSNDGSIHHRGDNLTGADGAVSGTVDDENIDVKLDNVNSRFDRLVFVINIFTSGVNNFKDVRGLYLNIYDMDTNDKLIEYKVEQSYRNNCSLVIGEARRTVGGWEFLAIGEGTDIKNVHDLANYCAGKRW